jgi:phytoene dehydrogenase-like protein
MHGRWDTIVVGAGVGGLTAAAMLVKKGLRVLVLERNPHPGGTAYVYRRKGFSFPMGPLGFSHPGVIKRYLKELGEDDDLQFSRVHYRIKAFDLEIPLSLPFSEMKKELPRHFPSDAQGIEDFFKAMEEIASGTKFHNSHIESSLIKRTDETFASKYLSERVHDWRLRRILGSLGTREPYSGLSLLAAMWNLMCQQGIWYPKGGMRLFGERLANSVAREKSEQESGVGEIRLGTEVAKIRVEQGRVLGVTLSDGTKIDGATVISNADYKTTFMKLMDPQVVPESWYGAVSNARQTGSVLQVCLALGSTKVDLSSFKEASRLIYRRKGAAFQGEDELNWNAAQVDPKTVAGQELEISLWSRDDETLAPEGGAVMVIRTEADYSHFARYRPAWRARLPEYYEYKNRIGQAILREIENLLPGLEDSVIVMDVATPVTFEEQGGRYEGAVAGWSWDYEDFQDGQARELVRTPIKGLYMAGYQAFSALLMGGVPTAMESGNRAASAVLLNVGPIEKIMIPGRQRTWTS